MTAAAIAHTAPVPAGGDTSGARPRVVDHRRAVDHRAGWDRDRVRAAALFPPERVAAVRLVRARQLLDRAAALGDARAQALARRHIDVVEADARNCLSRPVQTGGGPDEQVAAERARAGLSRMLDPDPVTRKAGADDLTRAWPAEHLELLRGWAERQQHQADPVTDGTPVNTVDTVDGDALDSDAAGQGDAVAHARAAVAAIGPADLDDDHDTDTAPSGGYQHVDVDVRDSAVGDVEGWSR